MKTSNEQFNQLSYKFYFKEDDEKSRLFDDNEEDLLSKLTVIVEPGNALAASAFHYCSSIIDIKKIKDSL